MGSSSSSSVMDGADMLLPLNGSQDDTDLPAFVSADLAQ